MKQAQTQNIAIETENGSTLVSGAGALPVRMKSPLMRNNHNRPAGRIRPALAALALLVLAVCPVRAGGGPDDASNGQSLVFPPQSHPYGASYQEWAARYWQRTLSLPVDAASYAAPLSDGQSGEVWVLASPLGIPPTETFQLSIPEGKAMLITPLTFWVDNANCPSFTDFTVAELRSQVSAEWSQVSETSFVIDGVTIPGLTNPQDSPYLFDSTVFSYTLPDHDTYPTVLFGATCIANGTTIDGAVAEGEFLMVKPLPVGPHLIHMSAVFGPTASPFLVTDITFVITVTGGTSSSES